MSENGLSEPVRVGVVGLGRSGYGIHLKAFARRPDLYQVVAVADGDEERSAETGAEFDCRAYATPEALFADPDVELVVVATPNFLHAPNSIAALRAGKSVVCEKPFGLTVADVDAMIGASEAAARPVILTAFHNLRFDESFLAVRDVLASGRLGRTLLVRIALHGFSRRWDWQALRRYGGGQLYNNGSHMLDLAMELLELHGVADATDSGSLELFVDLRRALGSGDTEDHVRLTLRLPGNPEAPAVDVEVTTAGAYPQDRWLVMGTLGGLRGTTRELAWKWLDPAELPDRAVQEASTPDRSYNREELPWYEETRTCSDTPSLSHDRYYESLWRTLRRGEPLAVTPESMRRRIAVIERALSPDRAR